MKKIIYVCDRCFIGSRTTHINDELRADVKYKISVFERDLKTGENVKLDLCYNCFQTILSKAQFMVPGVQTAKE